MWRSDTSSRSFTINDRVSLFGEITAVDDEKGEVTIRINGAPVTVTLSNENVVLLARN
jgi:preprotein translocase subunit YajC